MVNHPAFEILDHRRRSAFLGRKNPNRALYAKQGAFDVSHHHHAKVARRELVYRGYC